MMWKWRRQVCDSSLHRSLSGDLWLKYSAAIPQSQRSLFTIPLLPLSRSSFFSALVLSLSLPFVIIRYSRVAAWMKTRWLTDLWIYLSPLTHPHICCWVAHIHDCLFHFHLSMPFDCYFIFLLSSFSTFHLFFFFFFVHMSCTSAVSFLMVEHGWCLLSGKEGNASQVGQ